MVFGNFDTEFSGPNFNNKIGTLARAYPSVNSYHLKIEI